MTSNANYAYIRGSSAANMDWGRVRYFKPNEFPLEELEFLNKYVVEELDKARDVIGIPVFVSPVKGAVVRFRENEQGYPFGWHDSAEKRKLGQAVDVFIPDSKKLTVVDLITTVISITRFRGMGIYFDTIYEGKPCVMLHFDLRHDPILWYCPPRNRETEDRKYLYSSGQKCYYGTIESLWNDYHKQEF